MGWFSKSKPSEPDPKNNDNKDIDVPSPQGNDGNSSWWFKPDQSNVNKKKDPE